MNKRLLGSMLATFLLISGCSFNEDKAEESNEDKVEESKSEEQNKKDSTENVKGEDEMKKENDADTFEQAIASAEEVKESNYSKESYAEYKKAIDAAKDVKANKNATKEQREAAVTSIAISKNKLVRIEETTKDDKTNTANEAASGITNTAVVFGFTTVQGNYNPEKVSKIDFFVGDSATPRTATLTPEGTFSRDLAADIGQNLTFKVYKGSELIQEGKYTVK